MVFLVFVGCLFGGLSVNILVDRYDMNWYDMIWHDLV